MRTIIATLLFLVSVPLFATPSTLIWIPSTDIQPQGVWHVGSDMYVYDNNGDTAPFIDAGLTYGVTPRIELGVDYAGSFANPGSGDTSNPAWFNGKVLLVAPTEQTPFALAAGVYNAGFDSDNNMGVIYGIGSYTYSGTRFSLGAYTGKKSVLAPAGSGLDDSGILAGIDRTVGKWWFGADYQSGKNALGAWNVGVGYAVDAKTSFIVGYDHYNVGAPHSFTLQVDMNL
ncbi:MAG: hypothetical protein ACYDBB_19125 [Armatimonadota bacterium]